MAKGVFLFRSDSIYEDRPEERYHFPSQYLSRASQFVGDWVLYFEPVKAGSKGYHAAAKVSRIIPDPSAAGMYFALIEPGSYLPFEHNVRFRMDGEVVEQGLLNDEGKISGRAQSAVRPISVGDFDRILSIGIPDDDDLLPRSGEPAREPSLVMLAEDQAPFLGDAPRERALLLTSRILRDRVFRRNVLRAYDSRCALTGFKLINGGGRAEAEAAHIKPVEADGPDIVTNGLALSGTVHWMFDRGLVSLGDELEILLSTRINDIDGIQKIINPTGYARLPLDRSMRPHPRYLQWHRENCFRG